MEFKQLEIQPEGTWMTRLLKSQHLKKSLIYIVLGAIAGFVFYYFSEGQHMAEMPMGEIVKSSLIGAAFGFFITNNPCARNKC